MSHGHDHKDYKRVFGDIEKRSRGLYVLCDGESPKSGNEVRQQNRAVCLGQPMTACKTCEHSSFTVSLQVGIGNQLVACPTWPNIDAKLNHEKADYEMVRREQCLVHRPYDYCSLCPNKDAANRPQTEPGWWEKRRKEA